MSVSVSLFISKHGRKLISKSQFFRISRSHPYIEILHLPAFLHTFNGILNPLLPSDILIWTRKKMNQLLKIVFLRMAHPCFMFAILNSKEHFLSLHSSLEYFLFVRSNFVLYLPSHWSTSCYLQHLFCSPFPSSCWCVSCTQITQARDIRQDMTIRDNKPM